MITIMSFGLKYPPAPQAKTVIRCTRLKNPHYDPRLRLLTGCHPDVQAFVSGPDADALIARALAAVGDAKTYTLAFCCVGGRHRSVAMAERLLRVLRAAGKDVVCVHRELHRW